MAYERAPTPATMVAPLDEAVDHVRGLPGSRVILEYGDYECPFARHAFREISRVELILEDHVRYAYRHFPLSDVHPHALAAAGAAEAAAAQGRFWEMHELLFHRQRALADADLHRYATQLGLDLARFERERVSAEVVARVRRDIDSGVASGLVHSTPTIFIDGVLHEGDYRADTLLRALER
jgi:protein-disulfide isomerase